uniref:Uncharacterized protein n=1 Tax=Picea sitchensis TaxID=3332 RepID=A0A6B9XWQ4_PICSI|nr:hypothetical protein Q903MT_gene4070 [Picea sitchensis]
MLAIIRAQALKFELNQPYSMTYIRRILLLKRTKCFSCEPSSDIILSQDTNV